MKRLERKFFRFCCKNFEHTQELNDGYVIGFRINVDDDTRYCMTDIVKLFSQKYNCSEKQLWNYVTKWIRKGFYICSSSQHGKFCFCKTHVNIDQYIDIIPHRIMSHNRLLRVSIKEIGTASIYSKYRRR